MSFNGHPGGAHFVHGVLTGPVARWYESLGVELADIDADEAIRSLLYSERLDVKAGDCSRVADGLAPIFAMYPDGDDGQGGTTAAYIRANLQKIIDGLREAARTGVDYDGG